MVTIPNPPTGRAPAPSGSETHSFINPYNFVSTSPRDTVSTDPLGDRKPHPHSGYADGTWSATIPIRITTRTPLLLPDQLRAEPATTTTPRTLGTRRDRHGNALLTGSTVKGLLRSAYEAITNSRYGVLDDRHVLPGAVRSSARSALDLFPGWVTQAPSADLTSGDLEEEIAEVKYLSYLIPNDYREASDPQPAVWLPIDLGRKLLRANPSLNTLDGEAVHAWIWVQRHPRRNFLLWRVGDLATSADGLPATPSAPRNPDWTVGRYRPIRVQGLIHWTDARFGNKKHDERLFVTDVIDTKLAEFEFCYDVLTRKIVRGWEAVIASYGAAHATERADQRTGLGGYIRDPEKWKLSVGRTLHLQYAGNDLKSLTPSMIGRDVFATSPRELIDDSLLPASRRAELSPADRVFGWVPPEKTGKHTGHRGQLRVTAPRVIGDSTSVVPAPRAPLHIGTLNGPKSSQYRFYLETTEGEPIKDRGERSATSGYVEGRDQLRGRKFYLPHRDVLATENPAGYWDGSPATRTVRVNGRNGFREYVAPPNSKVAVGTAIKEWVPAGVTIATELHVHNLSDVELGALLWLLALPEPAVYTTGLGKPLGFGAVRVEAEWGNVRIESAAETAKIYRDLTTARDSNRTPVDHRDRARELIDAFDAHLTSTPHGRRQRSEFLDLAIGYEGLPVHYPRVTDSGGGSTPKAEGFKWWVANERKADARYSLPHVGRNNTPSLEYLAEYTPTPRKGQGGQQTSRYRR